MPATSPLHWSHSTGGERKHTCSAQSERIKDIRYFCVCAFLHFEHFYKIKSKYVSSQSPFIVVIKSSKGPERPGLHCTHGGSQPSVSKFVKMFPQARPRLRAGGQRSRACCHVCSLAFVFRASFLCRTGVLTMRPLEARELSLSSRPFSVAARPSCADPKSAE